MINIPKGKEPLCLDKKNLVKAMEKNKIINLIEIKKKAWHDIDKNFSFKVYANKSIKDQLKLDFFTKCAYCESIFVQNSFGEVEHWRPKKKVKDNDIHKGYYWLASEWNNLLWACRVCNSQQFKGNNFPLKDKNKTCYHSEGDLNQEEPLLLNPCDLTIKVEEYLKFRTDGKLEGLTIKGETSIEIYGLNRPNLRAERSKTADAIKRQFNFLESAIQDIISFIEYKKALPETLKEKIELDINKKHIDALRIIKEINEMLLIEKEFSGMNRQLVKNHVDSLDANGLLYNLIGNKFNVHN